MTGKEIFDKATEAVNSKGLPQPRKPNSKDPEFTFPEDPNQIRSIEIGQWMLKFTGFLTYTTRLLGLVDSELVGLDAEYKEAINNYAAETREKIGIRVNAEVVESAVLKAHPDLEPLYGRKVELNAIRVQLEARAKIYDKGYAAMSRELARREMESKR
jgi:hypothetical protein